MWINVYDVFGLANLSLYISPLVEMTMTSSLFEFEFTMLLFQKSLNISQTAELHDDMTVSETHSLSEERIVSHLNVSVNATRHYKYVFLFHTTDNKICKIRANPNFEGMYTVCADHEGNNRVYTKLVLSHK